MPPSPRSTRAALQWASVAALVALLLLGWSGPAGAHTGFESSEPAADTVLLQPVAEVTIRFSGPAIPADEGFVVRLPDGDVVTPDAVALDDGAVWRLDLPEPIERGVVAVRWTVQAPDAHPIGGSFSFTVDAPAVEVPSSADDRQAGADPDEPPQAASPADPETAPASTPSDTSGETPTVEEFLAPPDTSSASGRVVGYGGRFLGIGGSIAAIGLLAFAGLVLGDNDPERPRLVRLCGPAGALVVVGAILESVSSTVGGSSWAVLVEPSRWAWVVESNAGAAALLRSAGGVVLIAGAIVATHRAPVPAAAAVTTATAGGPPAVPVAAGWAHDGRTAPTAARRPVWLLLPIAAVLLLASFAFDGHTATRGRWVVTGLIDVVHVLAGAVWAGGVFGLTAVLISRRRRGIALDGVRLGIRFSGIAALASALAGVAGVALTLTVLESLDQLVMTAWGRVLLAKVGLVAAATSLGAYNHYVVLPAVPADRDEGSVASNQLRRVVTVEAAVMVGIIAATALLIAADAGP